MTSESKWNPWIPAELAQNPFLLGLGLVIAFDALTPFLDSAPSLSPVPSVEVAEFARTALLLLVALAAKRAQTLFNQRWFLVATCISATAGVALVQLARFVVDPAVAALATAAGSVSIGIFWCFAFLKFYELYARVSLHCAIVAFIFCHLVGSALATFIVYLSARPVALILLAAIPLALLALGRRYQTLILAPPLDDSSDETLRRRLPLRPFALMLATLFVAALVRNRIPAALEPTTYFGPLLCAIALSLTLQIKRRAIHPRALYYLTLFLLMSGLLFYTIPTDLALVVSGGCVNAGYTCFDVLILALLCNICRRYLINPYWMFGLLGFIERLAYDIGTLAGGILATQPDETRAMVAFACAIVVTCAFVTLLTERDYRTSWGTMKDEAKANPVASYYQDLPDACATISEQFGLTRREEEVLLLLAQRKTVPDIERELYISNSTAKTHCKNIYKKLGIHKREELLVLLGHPSVLDRAGVSG